MQYKSQYQEDELNHPSYRQRVRYHNAPDQKRINMRENQDVAMFLMTVEIQRLLGENSELKMQLRGHHDLSLDRVGYEVQIRDLMLKLQSMQEELQYLRGDNERLTKLLRDLENTISGYEMQLKGYDPNWKRELERCQKDLARIQKKMGGDDIDDLRNQLNEMKKKCRAYENTVGDMNPDDLKRLLEEYKKKAQQFDDLNRKLNGQDPSALLKKMKELDRLNKQLGGDPDELLRELERLRKQSKENDDLRRELGQAKQGMGEQEYLRKQLAGLLKENDNLKRQLQELSMKLQDANTKLNQIALENQSLKDQMNKKDQELLQAQQQLKNTLNQMQDLQRSIVDMNSKLRQADQERQRMQNELDEFQSQNEQMTGIQDTLDDLNDQKESLQKEKDQLQFKLDNLLKQLQEKDMKIQELQDQLNRKNTELKEIQKQLKAANDKIEWIKKEFGLTDADLDPKNRKNMQNLKEQQMFNNLNVPNVLVNYLVLSAENERLGTIIDRYFQENQQLKIEINQSLLKFENLNRQNQDLLQQQQKFNANENDIQKLKEFYENKIVMLTMEVTRLKKAKDYASSSYESESQKLLRITKSTGYNSCSEDQSRKIQDLMCLLVMMSAEIETLRKDTQTNMLDGFYSDRSNQNVYRSERVHSNRVSTQQYY